MAVVPIIGEVVGQRQWTAELFSLRVRAAVLPFAAGQFARVGLAVDGENVMRPYSFVNAPGDGVLEFYYIVVGGGALSPKLAKLKSGDAVLINEKANGFLVLSEVPTAEQLWMLSTGTALGAFLSILKDDEVWQKYDDIVLAHAVRFSGELTYGDDIKKLLEKGGGRLRFVSFVSREKNPTAMDGRINHAIANGALQEKTGLSPAVDRSQFMLCGNPDMVKDTTAVLLEMGFARNRRRTPGHITMENYW